MSTEAPKVVLAVPVDEPPSAGALRHTRQMLAPGGAALGQLLEKLHHESAREQRKARKSMASVRAELANRLRGTTVEYDGQQVVVAVVTTGELVRAIEAEANVVKTEAMAQRSYDVHAALLRAGGPNGVPGSFEDWLTDQQALDADLSPDDRLE